MTRSEIVKYWIDSAKVDALAMDNLVNNGHNLWALFVGHLVVEKLLKAYFVKTVDAKVPRTHDLLKIAQKANMDLTEEQKDFLDEVTTFNIKARYPDYKNRFYRKATVEFVNTYMSKIKDFKQWIVSKINN
jgi:HEPN domain-containing protein